MNLGLLLNCSIDVDPIIPGFTSGVIKVLKLVIPIILIVYGMIDLAKAVMANDDKVMKEAQGKLIKRVIYAVVIFFIVAIVQLVFSILADAGKKTSTGEVKKSNTTACINCFINGTGCKNSID